jgi:hypothetical protein
MSKEMKIHQPTCLHCQALPMLTATQIIPGPNGMIFANIFCGACGCSVGVVFCGIASPQQPLIVKPGD